MRDYGKVYGTFWSSETTSGLSDDGKLLALYLMTCSHSTIAGVFRLPDGYAAEDLRWPSERVAQGFRELLAKGFANRCETTKWVWVVKHLEWNQPDNPNQRKSARKVALSVPDSCAWKLDFMRASAEVLAINLDEVVNRSGTVGEPLLNQKQEQKQEQKSSVPEGTDAMASLPPSAKDRIFALGIPLLTAAGVVDRNARSMLGMLSKRHGEDAVADAIDRCAHAQPVEPVAWLQAALKAPDAPAGRSGTPPKVRDIFAINER